MSDHTDAAGLFGLAAVASARYRRAAEARLRPTGLTWSQFGALSALSAASKTGPGLSQAELAHALETDSTTAMVLRGSLERKGLVERRDDPEDGRVKRLSLTAQGRRLLADAQPRVAAVLGSVSEGLSEAEVKRFLVALERLAGLGAEVENLASPAKTAPAAPAKRGRPRKGESGAAAAKPRAKPGRKPKAAAEGGAKRGRKPKAASARAASTKARSTKAAAPKKASTVKVARKAAPAAKKAAKPAPKRAAAKPKAPSKAAAKAQRKPRAKAQNPAAQKPASEGSTGGQS